MIKCFVKTDKFSFFFLVLVATAAPDQVKHDVIYLGIRMQTTCTRWDKDNGKDLEFMVNKQVCGLTVQTLRQKELVLLLYATTGR